jgi:transcriptional regulator EpsA
MSIEKSELQDSHESQENRRAQAIVHSIECAVDVRRKYQFFVWTQGSVQILLPHKLAICGVYDRGRKEVRLEAFNSIVVPAGVLAVMTDGQSQLMQYVINAWINNRGRALVVRLAAISARPIAPAVEALQAAGFAELLVHGVSRPQRATEIETLFVFASPGSTVSTAESDGIELMLPHLHSTYLRVQAIEREIAEAGVRPSASGVGYSSASISEREEQVLGWVREGMSNQEIGVQLGISPLTVKNHVQKILRKLGATNRAQAVARAMSMNLLLNAASDIELSRK